MAARNAGSRHQAAGAEAPNIRRKGGGVFPAPVPGFLSSIINSHLSPHLVRWAAITAGAAALAPSPAFADPASIESVIGSIRGWIAGILVALATLYLTIGAVRYLTAGGDPRAVLQSKEAMKNALIGYIFALLAPLIVDIVRRAIGF